MLICLIHQRQAVATDVLPYRPVDFNNGKNIYLFHNEKRFSWMCIEEKWEYFPFSYDRSIILHVHVFAFVLVFLFFLNEYGEWDFPIFPHLFIPLKLFSDCITPPLLTFGIIGIVWICLFGTCWAEATHGWKRCPPTSWCTIWWCFGRFLSPPCLTVTTPLSQYSYKLSKFSFSSLFSMLYSSFTQKD